MKKAMLALALAVPVVLTGCGQSGEDLKRLENDVGGLKEKVEKLEKGQQAIISQLGEIKGLLKPKAPQRPPFKEAVFDIGDDPFLGDADAVVTLVDFTDYQ